MGQNDRLVRPPRQYPRRVEITRAVAVARDMGIAVSGIEVGPDGTIRVTSGRAPSSATDNEFDRWDAAGRL
jgi:hypothetical protein